MEKTKWYIGCSGFHYNDWKEIFYPKDLPKTKWFEYYCNHFTTLELNVTFYRFPKIETLKNWYDKSPASFKFSVKAPRLITHYKKFNDSKRLLSDFYNAVEKGLKDKLGCVLFQLPKQLKNEDNKLRQIVESLHSGFNNVIEFRDKSWWNEEVFERLNKHAVSFSGISHPQLPDEVVKNTQVLYYRFHGAPKLYRSKYSKSDLTKYAKEVEKLKDLQTAFVYFNNTTDAAAVKNANGLITLTKDSKSAEA